MDAALRDRLTRTVWPPDAPAGTSVWAILDCARDPRIYPALRNSRLDYLCLFSGRLPRDVEEAAPHLIEVAPNYAFTSQLLSQGWGNSWGVFLRTTDASNLRAHLRGFLRVQDESERFLLFRYYDPRVLKVYLPTCLPNELRTVFGPIHSYLVEETDGKSVIEFQFDGHQLLERRIALDGESAERPLPAS